MQLIKLIFSLIIITWSFNAFAIKFFIVDTDVGVDDVIALLYLLQRPEIAIKAITIASDGNAHCIPAKKNTLALLKLMHYKAIPVACGQHLPMRLHHHFPTSVLIESDTLANTSKRLPAVQVKKTKQTAVNLLITTLQSSHEPMTLLAIGPLTNIAQALQKQPSIKAKIKIIYLMGGAIHVPGNLSEVDATIKNKTAEWNIYLDPKAADIVFTSGIPIVLVPLDLTNQVPIDQAFYQMLKIQHKTPAANFVFTLLTKNKNMIKQHNWYFWDPLAAVIADNPTIATYRSMKLKVMVAGPQSGSIKEDKHGQMVQVAVEVNKDLFRKRLVHILNQR